jgi:hypothetical protein
MFKFNLCKLPLVAAVLGAVLALAGVGYAASSALTITGKTTDALAETSSSTNLSTSGGQPVTLTSLSLPAGSWVLSSETTLVNFGPSDYTRCQILAGGNQIASGTTMVGDPGIPGSQGPAAYVAGRGLIGSVHTKTVVTASLVCWHDSPTPVGQPAPYADVGAVLWAHKAPVLSGTTN